MACSRPLHRVFAALLALAFLLTPALAQDSQPTGSAEPQAQQQDPASGDPASGDQASGDQAAGDQATGDQAADGSGSMPEALPENAGAILDTVATDQLQGLLETLQDETARAELVARLEALVAVATDQAQDPGALEQVEDATLAFVYQQVDALGAVIGEVGHALVLIPTMPGAVIAALEGDIARGRLIAGLWQAALVAGAGLLAWLVLRLAVRPARRKLADLGGRQTWWLRAPLLVVRLLVDAVPLASLIAVALIVAGVVEPAFMGRVLVTSVMTIFIVCTAVSLVLRFFLSPNSAHFRLLPIGDAGARLIYRRMTELTAVAITGYAVLEAIFLFGASAEAHRGLQVLLGLGVMVLGIVYIFGHAKPVEEWLNDWGDDSGFGAHVRGALVNTWPYVASAYLVVFFLVWAIDLENGFVFMARGTVLTVAVVLVARGLNAGLVHWSERLLDRRQADEEQISRRKRYLPAVLKVARVVIALALIVALVQIWGYDLIGFFAGGAGQGALDSAIAIAIILLLSLAAWEVINALVDRQLRETDARGNPVERSARLKTLLPLIRNGILAILVTIVGLIVLSEVGINIAPLLAGAGVIGLAIGFGAQTLVADIITGIFILAEDQLQVGDVVDTGGHVGLVEGMTIRTLRLRDISGTVHIIPFSQVTSIKNLTKEFSFYVFDVGVAYREDTDFVTEVLKEIGADLRQDPNYTDLILDDLQVLGVDAFADSAVIVKARIKTKPIQQWVVGREFNRRMKKRFDELGIEIPFPHTTLYFGVDKQGNAPPGNIRLHSTATEEHLADMAQAERDKFNEQREARRQEAGEAAAGTTTPEPGAETDEATGSGAVTPQADKRPGQAADRLPDESPDTPPADADEEGISDEERARRLRGDSDPDGED